MKKKLLTPPERDGEIICLPRKDDIVRLISGDISCGTAHQPYFFHPGIGLKFLLVDEAGGGKRQIPIIDTDRVELAARMPCGSGMRYARLMVEEIALFDVPTPPRKRFEDFLKVIESELAGCSHEIRRQVGEPFERFRSGLLDNIGRPLLKEVLTETLWSFYNLKADYRFLSDLTECDEYRDFVLKIAKEARRFREVFNQTIDDFGKEFRFRYRNYPFPKLERDELPFWLIKNGRRERLFETDIKNGLPANSRIFPRAGTLTLFLRMYCFDLFIHGISGGNYEWVQDRLMERFFNREPVKFGVMSGTFYIEGVRGRDFPYFFYPPDRIRNSLSSFLKGAVAIRE